MSFNIVLSAYEVLDSRFANVYVFKNVNKYFIFFSNKKRFCRTRVRKTCFVLNTRQNTIVQVGRPPWNSKKLKVLVD